MLPTSPRPHWLTSFWGALLTLGVMLSGRAAHAQSQPSVEPAGAAHVGSLTNAGASASAVSPTLAVLSASVAATLERAISSEGEATDSPTASEERWPAAVEVPIPPWMAGLCDARGATAIAPLPAMPVGDGAVAADESGCEGSSLRAGRTVEHNDQPAPPPLLDAIDPGLVPSWQLVVPVRETLELPCPRAAQFTLPPGFGRGIDEPPRG